MEKTILIIEDTEENIDILVDLLYEDYHLLVALDGHKGIELAKSNLPDLILLDVMMPGLNGYDVISILKSQDDTKHIPVIFLTALSEDRDEAYGIDLGAIDYIKKPFNPSIVYSRIRNYMMLKSYQNDLEDMVLERTVELEHTKDVIVKTMGVLAEFRDNETGAHIQRTQHYVMSLAKYLRKNEKYRDVLTDEVIQALFKSAPLHDIGKIAIPDHILKKPDTLTEAEFEIMMEHTVHGKHAIEAILNDLPGELFIEYAIEIAYTHHEKWDGSGYPRGLKGDEIPISGKIMAMADVYDALTSERVYKPAFSHEKAKSIILNESDGHFDPGLIEAFLALEDDFIRISKEYHD